MAKKNPRVVDVEIGTAEIKKLSIYPLSLAAETKLLAVIQEVKAFLDEKSEELGSYDDIPHVMIGEKIAEVITMNMEAVFESITKDVEVLEILDDIDNCQVLDIASVVFEQNFVEPKKKAIALLPKEVEKTEEIKETAEKKVKK